MRARPGTLRPRHTCRGLLITLLLGAFLQPAAAQEGDASDLAQKLSNPVASLISVPVQFNYNRGYGAGDDGNQTTMNIQPVIPISISEDWNVISRTIVPVIRQKDVIPGAGLQFGLGSITQSLFFSPKEPTELGLIWGAGPVFLLPTSTDNLAGDCQSARNPDPRSASKFDPH